MRRALRAQLAALLLAAAATPRPSEAASASIGADAYAGGRTRVSFSAGMASSFGQDYFLLGLGAGYYLRRGLEAGIDAEAWLGETPRVYKLSPQIRYVLVDRPGAKPYLGAFYRRTFFEGVADLDSAGGRAGIFTAIGRSAFAGAGLVYEKYFDCSEQVYDSCDSVYPELSISASF